MPESVELLDSINGPEDLKALTAAQMPLLAKEIREFLIDSCLLYTSDAADE